MSESKPRHYETGRGLGTDSHGPRLGRARSPSGRTSLGECRRRDRAAVRRSAHDRRSRAHRAGADHLRPAAFVHHEGLPEPDEDEEDEGRTSYEDSRDWYDSF
jgi:hypothetical protein